MRRKRPSVLTILLLIAGICVLMYPLISDWYNRRAQTTVMDNYDAAVAELEEEDFTELWEAAQAYNEGLLGSVILTEPFDETAGSELSEEYASLLNIDGDGVMGQVRIPKIDVKLPIYHGTSSETLKKGVGHLQNTSLPTGGIATHAVLSSHTGFPTAALFTDLDTLEEGDLFFLEILDETLAYRVDRVKVVEPSDISDLYVDREQDYVTLVTCTPYGVNSHRLLVRGVRTDYEEALEEEQTVQKVGTWNWPYIVAGVVLVLILLLYVIYSLIKRKKTDNKKHQADGKEGVHENEK